MLLLKMEIRTAGRTLLRGYPRHFPASSVCLKSRMDDDVTAAAMSRPAAPGDYRLAANVHFE